MSLISYAQNFEDVRLWRAFKDIGSGRYLDIGAQDPVRDSVSLAFYERGWRGVHVEPTAAYAAAMRTGRPDETVIEAAVSAAPGPLRFFEIPTTGLSTGKPEIAEGHKKAGWECREIIVPTVTLAGIFDIMGPDLIHWMKIDVEGMEADVLASWGGHPARPAALVIEATAPGTQRPTDKAWHALVTGKGYIEVLFDGLSRYFVHEGHAARAEALALSPNVFDGYQVPQSHFAAHHLSHKSEADEAALRKELEEERDRQVTAISEQLLDFRAHHEAIVAGLTETSEAALAEVERHRRALEKQLEANSAAHAATQAATDQVREQLEATQQELAHLNRQIVEEIEAHKGTHERAQADAMTAQTAIEEARGQLAALEARSAELAKSQAIALALAQNEAAANERGLAEATTQLNSLRQDYLSQVRENGVLEGRMAAQDQANAARLADSVAAQRQLSGQLRRAEQALETAQANVVWFQSELSLQARQHEEALASSDKRIGDAEAALTQANENLDRFRDTLGETQDQLAEQVELNNAGKVERSELQAECNSLIDELGAVRAQTSADVLALNGSLAQLQRHIEWRERQLQAAAALLDELPQPLAGLPRILAMLVRRWRSKAELAAIANHRTALDDFRAHFLLPPMHEVSHGAQKSTVDQTCVKMAAIEHGGVQNMKSHEPVTSVPRLLAPHDREFIRTAYEAVLGRAPDQEGAAYYLTRLRAGTHKLAILKQLRRSPEGRTFIPGVAGLDRAIKRHVWATLPVLGALLSVLWGAEGNSATHRALRMLTNDIGRLRADHVGLRSEQAALTATVRELAQSAFANPVAAIAHPPAEPHPETEKFTGAIATAEQSGADTTCQPHLADPLGNALSAAVERWQG